MQLTKGEQTKRDILSCAYHLAIRVGLSQVTIGALARESEMSKSGVYAHFGSKEQLQVSVLEWASELFLEQVIVPTVQLPSGLYRLRAFFEAWLRWYRDPSTLGGCIFVAAATEFDDQPGPVRSVLKATIEGFLESLEHCVGGAQETGQIINAKTPQQIAFEIYALLLGYHHSLRLLDDREAHTKVLEAYESLIEHYTAS